MEFRAKNNFTDLTGWKAAARGNGNKNSSKRFITFNFGFNIKTTDTNGKITVNQMYTSPYIATELEI